MDPQVQRNRMIKSALNALAVTGKMGKQYLDEDSATNSFEELSNYAKQYCILDIKYNSNVRALRQTEGYYKNFENDISVPVKTTYKRFSEPENQLITDNAVAQHPFMIQFVREVEADEEDNDKEGMEEDEDIVESNNFVPPIDPITKTAIKNPVRNTQCGHVYENDTIRSIIAKKNTRCPYIGCPAYQYINPSHLVFDDKLKRKIESYDIGF